MQVHTQKMGLEFLNFHIRAEAPGTQVSLYKARVYLVTGVSPISNNVPEKFWLFQNYPNPFNPATKIKFNIPLLRGVSEGRGVFVRIIVYDILGREIETLVNEALNPGTYEVSWDASNYPSGIYFYKLTTDGYIDTRKMIFLK